MRYAFLLPITILLLSIGCARAKPEGLADLVPTTVTVVDGERPLPDIYVTLSSKPPRGDRSCAAQTDRQGDARIETKIRGITAPGVPVGEYVVTFSMPIPLPPELALSADDMECLSPAEAAEHQKKVDRYMDSQRRFSKFLSSVDTSPLALTVEGKQGAELRVDISQY